MATYYTDLALDSGFKISTAEAGEVCSVTGVFTVATALALNDIVHMCWLPARHVIEDCIFYCDELDTGVDAIVIDVGLTLDSVGATEDPNALISASTVGQAGGMARMDQIAGMRIAAVDNNRLVGITVTTGPGTGATGVNMELQLRYKANLPV